MKFDFCYLSKHELFFIIQLSTLLGLKMFKHSYIKSFTFGIIGFLSLALISISSFVFAQDDMILVADNSFNTSHLVKKFVEVSPSLNSVKVVRNYKNQVDFGSDPITDEIWYPHKSATINYYVDCELGKLSIKSWKLYENNNASGEIIWADQIFGNLSFYSPGTDEELNAVINTCDNSLNIAAKQF